MTKNMNKPGLTSHLNKFNWLWSDISSTPYVQIHITMQLFSFLPSSISLSNYTKQRRHRLLFSERFSHDITAPRQSFFTIFPASYGDDQNNAILLYFTQPHHVAFLRINSGPDFWLCMWSTCFKTADTQRPQPHLDKLTVHICFTIIWI